MKRMTGILLLVFAAAVGGCIDAQTMVAVKKDGTGYVVETVFVGEALRGMVSMMGAGPGGEAAVPPMGLSPDTVEKAKARASRMGLGVRHMSTRAVKGAGGREGVRTVYAFDDVRRLKVALDGGMSGSMEGMAEDAIAGGEGGSDAGAGLTFDFRGGSRALLTINLPEDNAPADATGMPEASGGKTPDAMSPEALAGMKAMFDGLRLRVVVKVDGEIASSNAAYVEPAAKGGKRQYVTLLDMDFSKLMGDPERVARLAAMGDMRDVATAREALKDMPGLKFETSPRVRVAFQ